MGPFLSGIGGTRSPNAFSILILPFLLFLASCSSVPRVAPRFVQPSTTPIAVAHKATQKHIEDAKVIVREIEKDCPDAKPQVAALTADLDGALSELATSEGARVQLETQLKSQTQSCNDLADNYDKAATQIETLKQSRHHWVKLFWYSTIGLVLAAAWIFHKPLLMAAGMPPL